MRLLPLSICLFFLSVAASAQSGSYLIPLESKFSSDARVEFSKDPIPKPFSTGSMNGVAYKFDHATGNGFIEGSKGVGVDPKSNYHAKNWELRCESRLTHKQCGFMRGGIFLISYVNSDGPGLWLGTLIGSAGSPTSLTVDGRTIYDKGRFVPDATEILGSGKQFTVLYNDDSAEARTLDLYGFNEAFALSQWAVKQIELIRPTPSP